MALRSEPNILCFIKTMRTFQHLSRRQARLLRLRMESFKSPMYALVAEALEISKALLEAGGEITPEIEAMLAVNEASLSQKTDSYSSMLDRMEIEEKMWRIRRDDCERMLRGYEAVQEKLRERMKSALIAMGRDEISGEQVRFKLARAKPKLVLYKELPGDCYISVTTLQIDKERVRTRLEAGEEIPGANLIQGFALRKYLK